MNIYCLLIDGNKMAHSNNVQADNFTALHIHYTTRICKFHIKSCMIVIIELGKYALNCSVNLAYVPFMRQCYLTLLHVNL